MKIAPTILHQLTHLQVEELPQSLTFVELLFSGKLIQSGRS